jgi:hypothetical protein
VTVCEPPHSITLPLCEATHSLPSNADGAGGGGSVRVDLGRAGNDSSGLLRRLKL